MARETVTRLVDDLDGGVAHETVRFGLDGQQFEIDLSTRNAKKLRAELAPFVEHGNRLSARVARARARQIGTHAIPAVTTVGAAEKLVRREVQRLVVVR